MSGPSLCKLLEAEPRYKVEATAIVPDDFKTIQKTVTAWCDDLDLNIVLTTGGTGFGVRDCTPEVLSLYYTFLLLLLLLSLTIL